MPVLLIPNGCEPKVVNTPFWKLLPPRSVKTPGVNGVGAKPPSQNWRKYLKSANTVRYLSQISRSNERKRYSRSVAAIAGVRSAKVKNERSLGSAAVNRLVYSESVNWFALECGVGVLRGILKAAVALPKNPREVTRPG